MPNSTGPCVQRDTEKRCVVTDPRRSGAAGDAAEPSRSSQGESEHVAARLPHVWDRLTLRLNDILTPRVPTQYPQAMPEPSTVRRPSPRSHSSGERL